jgi:hypothetical protein
MLSLQEEKCAHPTPEDILESATHGLASCLLTYLYINCNVAYCIGCVDDALHSMFRIITKVGASKK